ncbi:hypothetical protein [Sporosarcina psychrophila]|uniref:Benzoyl-CoA reductase/2-hydroxyglutaryl-CoA dehydratase subunit BcrC/BadD/HgdB n=1 Tax=Sporosarcina psychrophila TaxID=1476 RepID=A0ABV2KBY8_SPOPS
MNTKRYYQIQLETFMELKEKCTHKVTLEKLNSAISKYQKLIDDYDEMDQSAFDEECQCSTCAMQG